MSERTERSSMTNERDDAIKRAIELCHMTQSMIDITAKQLDGLRTVCSTSEEITQKEIRESEGKLIKLFGKQLITKTKLKLDELPSELLQFPKIQQWLKVVGIRPNTLQGIMNCGLSVERLLGMNDHDLTRLMSRFHSTEEEVQKLRSALANLKRWTENQLHGNRDSKSEQHLHWTSYKSCLSSTPVTSMSGDNMSHSNSGSPMVHHHQMSLQRSSTSSLPANSCHNRTPSPSAPSPPSPPHSTPGSPFPCISLNRRYTPPPTPTLVKPSSSSKGKFPTTPPPQKRNKLYPEAFHPLTKSKSHESQLSTKVNQDVDISKYLRKKPHNLILASSHEAICSQQRKRSTDGSSGQASPLISSPKRSPPYKHHDQVSLPDFYDVHPNKKNHLVVPLSPNTPVGSHSMLHSISHSFQSKLIVGGCDLCHRHVILGKTCRQCKFQTKLVVGSCDLCHKQMFRGKVCKYCKLKFHRDCAAKAAPACGLPPSLVDIFLDTLRRDGSPTTVPRANHSPSLQSNEGSLLAAHSTPDSSSSTSSCNSSTPSSPALYSSSCPVPHSPAHQQPSPQIQIIPDSDSQFKFPDVSVNNLDNMTVDSIGTIGSLDVESLPSRGYYSGDFVSTSTSNDSDRSDRTLTGSLSSSERTALLERGDSMDNGDDPGGQSWQRANSISIALKEWDIPFEELVIGDKIGSGRFGTVHKGNWHGDVAIKMLNMETNLDHQAQLQAFKLEVAMLRKTRHENLVLFMGACMKQPHLAVITSLCKGHTLYTHIHMRKERFQMNRMVIIASQVAQNSLEMHHSHDDFCTPLFKMSCLKIQGMGYLHAKGIIHKDLKSRNIFLESGKVVITDFGLSNVTKLCHGNRKGEYLSIPEGWLCYLSPEIIRSLQAGAQYQEIELPFTEASDVFAFGTVWYELLSGEWPFKAMSPEAIIWQIGKGMKQSLGHIQASRDVKDILMLCWAYASHKRSDFRTLLEHLERLPKKRLARSPSHPIQLSRSAESVF